MQSEAHFSQGPVLVQNLQDSSGRMPPHAIDLERSILGGMLLDRSSVSAATAILDADAFYLEKHSIIFQAICDLFANGQTVDLFLVAEQLKAKKQFDTIGGIAYLTDLTDVGTGANTEHYARIISQKAILRHFISLMNRHITEAYDPGTDALKFLDEAQTNLFKISERQLRRSVTTLDGLVKNTIRHLQSISDRTGDLSGVTSGFADLDKITGGWQNSDLIIVAGRPSMGKCVDAETPILQSDGQLVRIKDLYEQQDARLLTLGKDSQFSITEPSAYLYDGLKPVYQVTTCLGRIVKTTLSHPFLTPDGWTPLNNLSQGSLIAVPRELPVFGARRVSTVLISQLAHAILHPHQAIRPMPGKGGVSVLSKGLQVLPHWVFSLTRDCLATFLDRLCTGKRSIRVSSGSIARQLAHLYLRFGTLTKVRKKSDGWWVMPVDSPPETERRHHIIFDEITQIEALGLRPVYDLTIDETHNFVASDVCVHNTAFALACARNAAMHEEPVSCAIFSLEMSSRQLTQRLLTSEARVNAQAARAGNLTPEDFEAIANAASKFHGSKIFIDDTASLSVFELRAKCMRLKTEHDLGLILVDYLQLMQGRSADNREQEIATISRSLKALAKDLDVPVIALSQLNRNAEDRKDRRPQLSDLRESGAIEQDADVVAFIYRASYYGFEHDEKTNEPTEGMAEIIIGKHRNGPTGTVKLSFLREYAHFANLEKYHQPEDFI